ncbi:hypothetical protein OEZ86_007152 [Tetradesmus obliquus]|nr:hypothetical protein OEZ86_007152 [Tetradesmus obliquus]
MQRLGAWCPAASRGSSSVARQQCHAYQSCSTGLSSAAGCLLHKASRPVRSRAKSIAGRVISSKQGDVGFATPDVVRSGGSSSGRSEYEDDRELPIHRVLQERGRELSLPEAADEDEDADAETIAAATAAAAAAAAAYGRPLGPPPLGPHRYTAGVGTAGLGAAADILPGSIAAAAAAAAAVGSVAAGDAAAAAAFLQDSLSAPSIDCGDCGAGLGIEPSSSGRVGCPVFVMLPLDTVWVVEREGRKVAILKRERALEIALHTLRKAGVEGVMVDVWWGICERAGPRVYDFSAYRRLFHKCAAAGLKVQAVMSFHAAGGNVGDTCKIPLPKWVLDIGERNPDIFYTDKQMHRNKECLSLGCDEVPLFWGRSPVDMYRDFVDAFANAFDYLFGAVITEITVGLGPAGELRYPSYPEGDGRWRFPGVGEYQCCDKYMLADLRAAARAVGHPEWGHGGPHDAGHYNSRSWETGFFVSQGGNWQSEYGHFFLSWYSGLLVRHARRVLGAAADVLNKPGRPRMLKAVRECEAGHVMYEFQPVVQLGAKLAGVHWWFKSRAHAAELTAGYYNTRDRDGYAPIIQVIAEFNGRLSFTCVEMRDCEHPPEGRCSPQGLLQQVLECAERYGVPLAGENALQRYDEHAFDRIAESAFGRTARAGRLEQLTFLRMGDLMFDNWDAFCAFLRRMRGNRSDVEQAQQAQLQQQQVYLQQQLLAQQYVGMAQAQQQQQQLGSSSWAEAQQQQQQQQQAQQGLQPPMVPVGQQQQQPSSAAQQQQQPAVVQAGSQQQVDPGDLSGMQ